MIFRLDPPLPVKLVLDGIRKRWAGEALAHAWIDYGVEHDLKWICACENGEWYIADNTEVRSHSNLTFHRELTTE